jgi:5'(3')-deoxyribonucleotidase
MKKIIFVDMDDCIAEFEKNGGVEKMNEKNFFYNLEIKPFAKQSLQLLNEMYDLHILSLCIDNEYCKDEKMQWLEKHMPFIKKQNIHLIKNIGKAEYIKNKYGRLNQNMILIDDYKKNLLEWKNENGRPIKYGKNLKQNRPYEQINNWKKIMQVILA